MAQRPPLPGHNPKQGPKQARAALMRELLVPSLLALAGLLVLLGLGTWQMQRLAFKQDLSHRIKARLDAPPVPLQTALALYRRNPEEAEYLRLKLKGRFLNSGEIHLYGLRAKKPGWLIITPFRTEEGPLVFVNRGFVPRHLKEREKRKDGLVEGLTEVTGLLRAPTAGKGAFAPANRPRQNRWFSVDLPAMAAQVPGLAPDKADLVPFIVDAEAQPGQKSWPRGGATRIKFENRHLEYALTWYGLAAALLGVYIFFVISRTRRAH